MKTNYIGRELDDFLDVPIGKDNENELMESVIGGVFMFAFIVLVAVILSLV